MSELIYFDLKVETFVLNVLIENGTGLGGKILVFSTRPPLRGGRIPQILFNYSANIECIFNYDLIFINPNIFI